MGWLIGLGAAWLLGLVITLLFIHGAAVGSALAERSEQHRGR